MQVDKKILLCKKPPTYDRVLICKCFVHKSNKGVVLTIKTGSHSQVLGQKHPFTLESGIPLHKGVPVPGLEGSAEALGDQCVIGDSQSLGPEGQLYLGLASWC